ncbi:MAG: helix-turn-helix domain-containing protein [Lentisphaerota bacterium]
MKAVESKNLPDDRFFRRFGADIRLKSANFYAAPPSAATTFHLHPDLLHIAYILSGKCVCRMAVDRYELGSGMMHFVFPNELHQYQADAVSPYIAYFVHIFWIGSRQDFLPRTIKLSGRAKDEIEALLRRMNTLSVSPETASGRIKLHGLLSLLMAEVIDLSVDGTEVANCRICPDDRLAGVLAGLSAPPFDFPGIDQLAGKMKMGRRVFTDYFRTVTGMSVREYHLRCKMYYGRSLVNSGEFNLKETAFQCGYANPQNFSRAYNDYFSRKECKAD